MRMLLGLACCLALAAEMLAEDQYNNKSKKKKGPHPVQQQQMQGSNAGKPTGTSKTQGVLPGTYKYRPVAVPAGSKKKVPGTVQKPGRPSAAHVAISLGDGSSIDSRNLKRKKSGKSAAQSGEVAGKPPAGAKGIPGSSTKKAVSELAEER